MNKLDQTEKQELEREDNLEKAEKESQEAEAKQAEEAQEAKEKGLQKPTSHAQISSSEKLALNQEITEKKRKKDLFKKTLHNLHVQIKK